MEIFNIDKRMKLPKLEVSTATIGQFDGLHLGHQKLIKETKAKDSLKSMVITFDNVLKDDNLILTLEDRIKKIEDMGVDYLIILKYSDFKMVFYSEFIKMLKKMRVDKIIIGKDFRFGFQKEGDYIDLENNFEVKIIPDYEINNTKVSTTLIKDLLRKGNVKVANSYLGYNYFIQSEVVTGSKLGRTINFPTANFEVDTILKNGVYKTNTIIDGKVYKSMTNIGYNPTFNLQKILKIETMIIDFNKDIYGKTIKVEFLDFIRDEKKFSSKEELIEELERNLESVK